MARFTWGLTPRSASDSDGNTYVIVRQGGTYSEGGFIMCKINSDGNVTVVSDHWARCDNIDRWFKFRPYIGACTTKVIATGEHSVNPAASGVPKWNTWGTYYKILDTNLNISSCAYLQDADGEGHTSVDCNSTGNFIIVWHHHGENHPFIGPTSIYRSINGGAGSIIGEGVFPKVEIDNNGNHIVAWENNGEVYVQLYDNVGESVGQNILVGSVGGMIKYWEAWMALINHGSNAIVVPRLWPAFDIAISKQTGNFAVAWSDARYGGIVVVKFYNTLGIEIGEHIVPCRYQFSANPSVAIDNEDNALVCWNSYREGGGFLDIYSRSFNIDDDSENYVIMGGESGGHPGGAGAAMPHKNIVKFHSPDAIGR